MENVTITQVAAALVNLAVLVFQYLVFRFIRSSKLTTNQDNQKAIASIAQDLNNVTRSISLTMAAAGLFDEKPGEGKPLSPEDQAAARNAAKAALWRGSRRGGGRQ